MKKMKKMGKNVKKEIKYKWNKSRIKQILK